MKIEQLKKGELFMLPGKKTLYVYVGYCRPNRKYEFYRFDDISSFHYRRKGTLVEVNF